ncbi:hypothetical protein [Flexibacter flexilis]|uniref:hypothetical protein n=1 Tax=Flexibacter flexilis TaxID=998 RepID=UPI000B87D095|nr:hypothetical protein [Flexibacter flexilis]
MNNSFFIYFLFVVDFFLVDDLYFLVVVVGYVAVVVLELEEQTPQVPLSLAQCLQPLQFLQAEQEAEPVHFLPPA